MMENDATACLLAELTFARMDGVRDAVLVAVAEGVGTCVLANGQLVAGHNGMAGEFGHIPIDPNGPRCGCGKNGCWEVFSSCRAALRYYRELRPKGPVSRLSGTAQSRGRRRFGCRAGPDHAGQVDWPGIADDHRQRFSQHDSDCRRPHLRVASFWAGDREGGGRPHPGRQFASHPADP